MKIVAVGGTTAGSSAAARAFLDGPADVVLAPQSHPAVHVLRTVADAATLHTVADGSARTAVVLGADAVGLAAVEALREHGLDIMLVETAAHVLPGLDAEVAWAVQHELTALGVEVRRSVGRWTVRASDDVVEVALLDSAPLTPDVVVVSVGAPSAPGTTTVRVGALTLALVGALGANLDRVPHQTFHLRPAHAGGFYQGDAPVLVVLHVDSDGEVLGAQAVGTEGVEARIEVLVGALAASPADAETLQVAALDTGGGDGAVGAAEPEQHAVPDDTPADHAHLAGLLATCARDGRLRLWYPDELDDVLRDTLVLDVRSADEFAGGHLAGAVHMPHHAVPARLDEVAEVAAGRPVRLHCQTGYRSYVAHRTLAGAGLDSAALSGGLTMLLAARPGTRLVRGAAAA